MMIDDPKLINSHYTNLLNERCPQRKYLRHNLTSWLRCNKRNDDIMVRLMNPKVKIEDFNMKRLSHKGTELVEDNITSIEDARNIIELLKLKLMEYEITNNKNIEEANEFIGKLNEDNEFLRKKLIDSYDKIAHMESTGDGYINEADIDMADSFRSTWLKFNAFQMLKYGMINRKLFKIRYEDFTNKRDHVLKLKAFLSLEKNRIVTRYEDKYVSKYRYKTLRKVFNSLRYNCYINKLQERFKSIQRTVRLMVYMKDLKYNSLYGRYHREINKKALFKYYFSLTSKSLAGLRSNTLTDGISGGVTRGISFLQFFKNADLDFKQKQVMAKGIMKIKTLVDKVVEFQKNRIINHPVQSYALGIYFNRWRNIVLQYRQVIQFKAAKRKLYFNLFFKYILRTSYIKRVVEKERAKIIHRSFFRFFKVSKKRSDYLSNNTGSFIKRFYYKLFFEYVSRSLTNQPYVRYVSLSY
jgi:hypothetical protein